MQFLQPPVTSPLLKYNIPLSTLFSNTLSVCYVIHNYTVLIFENVINLNLKMYVSNVILQKKLQLGALKITLISENYRNNHISTPLPLF
jgi:hypothetical protein